MKSPQPTKPRPLHRFLYQRFDWYRRWNIYRMVLGTFWATIRSNPRRFLQRPRSQWADFMLHVALLQYLDAKRAQSVTEKQRAFTQSVTTQPL